MLRDMAVAGKLRFIGAEPHGAAKVAVRLRASASPSLLIHSVMMPTTGFGRFAEFGRGRAGNTGRVARAFDAGHLHAEADAEERHLALAREANRGDLAFRAALAEPAGHQDAVHRLERAAISASSCSKISASIQRMLTFTRLAMPPWTSASLSDL